MRKAIIIINIVALVLILPARDLFNMKLHHVVVMKSVELTKSGDLSEKAKDEFVDVIKPVHGEDINTYLCIPVIAVFVLNLVLAWGIGRKQKYESA
jgi:hypothetical protein